MQRVEPDLNLTNRSSADDRSARFLSRFFTIFLYALSAYLIIGGIVSFAAWPLDMPRWADWGDDGLWIQPNTAIAAISIGIALLFRTRHAANLASVLFALFTFLIGIASLFQLVAGLDLGINTLFTYERAWGQTGLVSQGQMGFPSSASWTILGLSLALLSFRNFGWIRITRKRLDLIAYVLGFSAVAISLLSLIGYLYNVDTLYSLPRSTAIAFQTATFVFIAGIGVVLSPIEGAPRRLLSDPGTEGQVLRRLIPVMIIVPIVLGYLTLVGNEAGLFAAPFGIALRSILEIAVLFTILFLSINAVKKQATRAAEFEVVAVERERRFTKAFNASPMAITITSLKTGKLIEVNDAFVEATGYSKEDSIGKTTVELGLWDNVEDRTAELATVAEAGSIRNQEYRFRTRDGSILIGLLSAEVIEVNGEPCALTVIQNITDIRLIDEQLKEAEERFRLAQQAGKVGVWDWNAETNQTYWSDTMWELYDEEVQDINPDNEFWLGHLHPDDVERVRSSVQATVSSNSMEYVDEFRILSRSGLVRWIDIRATVVRDPNGKTTRMYGVNLDITESKAIQDRIVESEGKIRTITDSIPVLVAQIGEDHRFQFTNKRFGEWFGRRTGKIEGETLETIFGEQAFEIMKPAIAEALSGTQSRVETLIDFPKVGPKYVEFAFTPRAENLAGETSYFLLINDLTDRRTAEEQLRRSEERMRVLMWSLTEHAILSTDSMGKIEAWNRGAEQVFGYEQEEIMGESIEILFTPEDLANNVHIKEMTLALKNGHAADDRWHLRKDGTRFFASGEMTPVRVGDELIGFAKVVRDLTEAKRMSEELQRAHDELDQRVTERTRELADANLALTKEMSEREIAERHRFGLLQRILTIQEDERGRLARDMHDQLGQRLTALRLKIQSLRAVSEPYPDISPRVDRLQEIAELLDGEVSFLAWELRPAILDNMPFVEAMENYVSEWSRHAEIFAEFHVNGIKDLDLGKDVENNLYRITQEALNNAAKHAQATRINVLLERRRDDLMLIIEDNGVGFDLEKASADHDSSKGFGLFGLRERALLISGIVEFETRPGEGTSIFIKVPLP